MAELRYVDWDGLVYYDGKIKQFVKDKMEDCIKMGGIIQFEFLPPPSFQNVNYIYKISDEFISNDYFVKPNLDYKAGTWVQVTDINNVYKYTIFNEEEDGQSGPISIDLSDYYKKNETEELIDSKIEESGITTFKQDVLDLAREVDGVSDKIDGVVETVDEIDGKVDTMQYTVSAMAKSVTDINQTVENISNTYVEQSILENYVTNEFITQQQYVTNNYIVDNYTTTEQLEQNYVTTQQVTEVVTQQVTKEVETKVTEVIKQKVESGEIAATADKISYGDFEEDINEVN